MHIFFSDFLHFDMSLLLLTVTVRGYLISIAYCLFFHFCFVVAICDLVRDVETIFHLSGLQFHRHHSYFRKDFQMLLTIKEGYT